LAPRFLDDARPEEPTGSDIQFVPGQYNGVPRHIHFTVTLAGYKPLTTRWQVEDSESPAGDIPFNFVLDRV